MTHLGCKLYKNGMGSVFTINSLLHTYFPKENPEFKYIKGYEGLYGVSKDGRVWTYNKEKVMSALPSTRSPYLYVTLYKENHGIKFSIHRLVAQTYIPNPNNLPEVDHIDRNIHNNDVSNLRWITRKGNLLNTEMQFTRNFRNCDLYCQDKFIDHFKSINSAARYAHEKFNVSLSGITKFLHSGGCELKCND